MGYTMDDMATLHFERPIYITDASMNLSIYGPFKDEEIEQVHYHLSPPDLSVDYYDRVVKVSTICTLKNGRSFGNVISIPWETLRGLIAKYT